MSVLRANKHVYVTQKRARVVVKEPQSAVAAGALAEPRSDGERAQSEWWTCWTWLDAYHLGGMLPHGVRVEDEHSLVARRLLPSMRPCMASSVRLASELAEAEQRQSAKVPVHSDFSFFGFLMHACWFLFRDLNPSFPLFSFRFPLLSFLLFPLLFFLL